MTLLLYNLLFPLGLILFLPAYLGKMFRRGGYGENFGQRFGFYDRAARVRLRSGHRTWMHAVSVGEVGIALRLLRELRRNDPKFFAVLSTTTTTGYAIARAEAPPWLEVIYSPLDFWPITRRAFAALQPARLILVEAEVWPNLTVLARRKKVPIALVNARLSPRSEKRFRAFRFVIAPFFRRLNAVSVPEASDLSRWQALGVPAENLIVTGSIKYDPEQVEIDPAGPIDARGGRTSQEFILLGGSTHRGEEKILLDIFRALRGEFPELRLILAPRHIERAREIESEISARGLVPARRSLLRPGTPLPHVLLLDTTGELRHWYALAAVAFIGKSLTARGGQNPVEAVHAGAAVVFGPHMENFPGVARQLVKARGALLVADAGALSAAIGQLLRDPIGRGQMTAKARAVMEAHRGATRLTAELVRSLPPRV